MSGNKKDIRDGIARITSLIIYCYTSRCLPQDRLAEDWDAYGSSREKEKQKEEREMLNE